MDSKQIEELIAGINEAAANSGDAAANSSTIIDKLDEIIRILNGNRSNTR